MMLARIAIVGAGPAGLMAAEYLSQNHEVHVYDAMPSAGRKWLQAGRGGLNISHSRPFAEFMTAYGTAESWLAPMIAEWDADAIRQWMRSLGVDSFVGSSGRIFPQDKKAAPLLRAWLTRLKQQGVQFHMRHRLVDWQEQTLLLACAQGQLSVNYDAVILALGGASWPHLGSDGQWFHLLQQKQIALNAFLPANCGFQVHWSQYLLQHAGQPLKPVSIRYTMEQAEIVQQGELMLSATGLEGSLIYQHAANLRQLLLAQGQQIIYLDLLPNLSLQQIEQRWHNSNPRHSLSRRLQQAFSLSKVKIALVQEMNQRQPAPLSVEQLFLLLKQYPIELTAVGSLLEAISTAGGVQQQMLNQDLMLLSQPGIFCAGEMLDWEAPTGGYLLTASLASGRWAAKGVAAWLAKQ